MFKIRHKPSTLGRIPLQLLNLLSFYLCKNIEAMTLKLEIVCWIFTVSIKRQTWAEINECQDKEMIKRSYFQELRP